MAGAANTTVRWASIASLWWWKIGRARRSVLAEALLDLPRVVVGVDHRLPGHGLGGQVGEVGPSTRPAAEPARPAPVDARAGGVDAHEQVLLQRSGAGGDLLGAFDHRVDRSVVTLVTREHVLVAMRTRDTDAQRGYGIVTLMSVPALYACRIDQLD
jgi:hypothetical protein